MEYDRRARDLLELATDGRLRRTPRPASATRSGHQPANHGGSRGKSGRQHQCVASLQGVRFDSRNRQRGQLDVQLAASLVESPLQHVVPVRSVVHALKEHGQWIEPAGRRARHVRHKHAVGAVGIRFATLCHDQLPLPVAIFPRAARTWRGNFSADGSSAASHNSRQACRAA